MSYVGKPICVSGQWLVEIRESVSPLSKVLISLPCFDSVSAWKTYRWALKETGKTFGGDDFGARIPQSWSEKS
jgi:hypothetical protein